MIRAILAVDEKGGIGKDGTLPWPKNKTDLAWFKNNTAGHVIVMGANTWEGGSFKKPLPRRINVVVSARSPELFEGAHAVISGDIPQALLELEAQYPNLIIWVIGGARIIGEAWPVIQEFYLTRIPGVWDCDTFLSIHSIEKDFKNEYTLHSQEATFEVWRRGTDPTTPLVI